MTWRAPLRFTGGQAATAIANAQYLRVDHFVAPRATPRGTVRTWVSSRLAYLVKADSVHSDDARLKQIEFPTPIHLAFDELELADLTLGLSV